MDKQLTPAFYSSSKRVFYALYDFLITTCGYKLPAVNAKSGTFTSPGDALVTGNFFVVETPDGAPFRQQIRFELNADSQSTHYIHVSHAPWVGVAGGWNSGGATFDAPKSIDERILLAQGTQKFTCVANSGRVFALAWWTPDTYSANTQFVNSGQILALGAGYDFALHGYVPGMIFAVTGTVSNNRSFGMLADVTSDTIEDVSPTPVNETVVATLTPRQIATALYVGAIDKAHGADVRPAAMRAGVFGMGAEWDLEGAVSHATLSARSFANNWRRIHQDVSGGYVNLVDGWLQMFKPNATTWPELQQLQPSASGNYTPFGALLCFSETVGQPRRELPAGSLDGVFLGPIGQYMQLLGASDELVVRDGMAAAWPSGVTP